MNERPGWTFQAEGFLGREYSDYNDYLTIQAKKLDERPGFALKASEGQRERLGKRLAMLDLPHGNVVCLGARLGGEAQAFVDRGDFAVGIDVNPGEKSKSVLHGDFHNLVFANESVDIIYTNSLDHALDMEKLITEVSRVLKAGGIFLTENKGGTEEPGFRGARSDAYDCMEWQSLAHLIVFIESHGFEMVERYRDKGFTPWGIMFRKCDDS